jgi:hypothetical protein
VDFHIPEDGILHSHRRENLKSYILKHSIPFAKLYLRIKFDLTHRNYCINVICYWSTSAVCLFSGQWEPLAALLVSIDCLRVWKLGFLCEIRLFGIPYNSLGISCFVVVPIVAYGSCMFMDTRFIHWYEVVQNIPESGRKRSKIGCEASIRSRF